MSGTPSISEAYAVLGATPHLTPQERSAGLALVVLTRAPWSFLPSAVTDLANLGFAEVLVVEQGRPRYDAEALVRRSPGARVLVPVVELTVGARLNAAAREVQTDRFLVVWDDQSLPDRWLVTRRDRWASGTPALAVIPELRDRMGQELPSVLVPGLEQDRLKILAFGADEDTVDTLFPRDYSAVYDRHRFLGTGGFDPGMTNPFWQKLEWGLRSRLWGESLVVQRGFRVDYLGEAPVDDQTPDASYPRFYLRNLAVRYLGDHGVLPFSRFWAHAKRSGLSWGRAWSTFGQERRWVETHRYRFVTDARLVAELWGTP